MSSSGTFSISSHLFLCFYYALCDFERLRLHTHEEEKSPANPSVLQFFIFVLCLIPSSHLFPLCLFLSVLTSLLFSPSLLPGEDSDSDSDLSMEEERSLSIPSSESEDNVRLRGRIQRRFKRSNHSERLLTEPTHNGTKGRRALCEMFSQQHFRWFKQADDDWTCYLCVTEWSYSNFW